MTTSISPDSLSGWKIKRVNQGPFKTIEIYSPNGCAASVSSHDRNPSNILYMLAEALLLAQATPSIPQAEPVSSIDAAQRKGYLGTAEEWREACRLFRARCSPEDCSAMARLRTYLEDGLLVAIRPPPPQPEGMGSDKLRANIPWLATALTNETRTRLLDEMVSRFLCWRLPDDFAPDAGITFKPRYNEDTPWGGNTHEPVGTNLLNAVQARQMLEHVLPPPPQPEGMGTYWMVERGSPCEWLVSKHGADEEWTRDSAKAQHFTEWGAKTHVSELERMGVTGPLRAAEHLDCNGPQPEGMGSALGWISKRAQARIIEAPEAQVWVRERDAVHCIPIFALPSTPENSNPLREALAELMALEDLKDKAEALHFAGPLSSEGELWRPVYETLRREYIRRQPLAWEAARRALSGSASTPSVPPMNTLVHPAQADDEGKAP